MNDFNPLYLLYGYLIIINIVTAIVWIVDKVRARKHHRKHRISENTLMGLAAVGGSAGALLVMLLFCHKTRHQRFLFGIPALLIFHIILVGLIVFSV